VKEIRDILHVKVTSTKNC